MNPGAETRIDAAAVTAAQIAAICYMLADTLAADPDTARPADAMGGIAHMANNLACDLFAITENNVVGA